MRSEESQVAQMIREAFHGVSLGNGVGLLQGQGFDDYSDAQTLTQYRATDEKLDWTRIDVAKLAQCHSSLSFFDAEGMRFHLPAYLIADLEGTLHQGTLHQEVIFHLTFLHDDAMSRFDLLNSAQRRAVREFLLLRRPDRVFDHERIDEALSAYWKDSD